MNASLRDLLDNLSKEELREVVSYASLLASTLAVEARAQNEFVHDVVRDELQRSGFPFPPYHVVLRSPFAQAFDEGAKAVIAYSDLMKPPTHNHRRRAYQIIVQSVIAGARQKRITISPKTICEQLRSAAAYMEDDFPSYATSGMLPALLKAKP